MKKEVTIELTDYCEHDCKFCSSETTNRYDEAVFISCDAVRTALGDGRFERIIISGGEPLSHPDFYKIFLMCRECADDVVVYTNLLRHISYNASVHDGIYVEAALTVLPDVSKVRVLKRISQGRERKRPEVHLSGNFYGDCSCDDTVIKPNGDKVMSPCRKESLVNKGGE